MKIIVEGRNYSGTYSEGCHVLTYAETGFSALSAYGEQAGVNSESLRNFEDQVNTLDEAGSLHPQAEISAIPRRLIRDACSRAEFSASLIEFLNANREQIGATKLIMSFRDDVNGFVVDECKRAVKNSLAKEINEVIIVIENMDK